MGGPMFRKVEGAGFGKNDAGVDGLVEPVPVEAKIRKGQSPASGTFAYSINGNALNGTNVPNGDPQAFELSYDGTNARLQVPGDGVDISDAASITDAVGVTVRARGSGSFATVENLRLQVPSSGIDEQLSSVLDARDNADFPDVDDEPERYCAFLDVAGLSEGFTLTGDATLTWDSNSSQEQPAVYFFAGATGA
jgi:hypothetical protein